jgi:hypothetical protein
VRYALLALAVLLVPACGRDDQAYCRRAQDAFAEVERLGADPAARTDPRAGLDRIKGAFAGLEDGAPDEVRDDVRTMTAYVRQVPDGEQLSRDEPPDVQAAGDRFAAWLGRTCPPA